MGEIISIILFKYIFRNQRIVFRRLFTKTIGLIVSSFENYTVLIDILSKTHLI